MDHERGAPTSGSEPRPEGPAGEPAGAPRARGGARGRATRRRLPERPCLNCGDPTPGEYCRSCGQRKAEVLVSVRAMVLDLLEDEFILNRRLPRTLSGLLFRPGFLTVEHVNGRIARYVRPFRLYLASSVVFFLLLSFFSLRALGRAELDGGARPGPVPADSLDVVAIDSALSSIRASLADSTLSPVAAIGLEQTRRTLEAQRERAVAGRDSLAPPDPAAPPRPAGAPERPPTLAERLNLEEGGRGDIDLDINTGVEALDSALVRRVRLLGNMTAQQAAERLVGDFLGYIPAMMFVLLPVFALVLKLFYVRRRRYYAEHFVFLLHVHAFVYLIFATLLIMRGAFSLPGWLLALLLGWTAVYIFLAMKRVYGQGWLRTLVKYWALGWMYFVILTVSIPVVFTVSVLLS